MAEKRAQARIMEMSFMLVFLALLLIIVALFIITASSSSIKKSAQESKQESALTTAVRLSESPELSCGEDSNVCVDLDKALALKKSANYKTYWADLRGLQIKKMFSYGAYVPGEVECTEGNYPACNVITLIAPPAGNVTGYSSYAILCREVYRGILKSECSLGKVIAYA